MLGVSDHGLDSCERPVVHESGRDETWEHAPCAARSHDPDRGTRDRDCKAGRKNDDSIDVLEDRHETLRIRGSVRGAIR